MTSSGTIHVRVGHSWIPILLFAFAMSLLTATPARAQSSLGCVADFGGVIDGKVIPVTPTHIDIDGNCIIRNLPASNPFTSNISFLGNNPTSWLVIFDNVVHTGQMSCDKSQGNFIWFTNGSPTGIKPNCQNLFVPEEKINKQNPAGRTTAIIGVPFTYKLTIPVLFDPLSGTVINSSGSPNDLHDITITDDLNATGADMTFVSERAYWLNGTPIPHTFSNVGGVLSFGGFPVVPAGQQFVIEVTVVLNDTPANVPGKQFANSSKWQFGRLINGTFYEPLPGQWGVTPPMTIAAPVLAVTKSGPATMNFGQWGNFAIDVQNTGLSDAWNVSLRDLLPHGVTGGMCDLTPEILSVQVFAADGVTAVAGKIPLNPGGDYALGYSAAPTCQLNMTMLTAAGRIGPNERLIIRYRTQLDANTQNAVMLTNVAGAIQWFNAGGSVPSRKTYTGTLTNGTPGILDHEDAHTVTVALSGFRALKISTDLTGDPNVLLAGETLRYTIFVKNVGNTDAVNSALRDAVPVNTTYVAGSTTLNGAPVADVAGVSPLVNGMLINSPANPTPGSMPADPSGQFVIPCRIVQGVPYCSFVPTPSDANVATITFNVVVNPNVLNGTICNQGFVSGNGILDQPSDDPRTPAPNDPTCDIVGTLAGPALVVRKSGPPTMNLGQWGNFAIDVQNTGLSDAWNVSLRDLLPHGATGGMCDLTPEILSAQVFAADGFSPVAGKGPLNPGSDYSLSYSAAPNCQLDITMLTAAGRIGPNERLIIRYRAQLDAKTQNGVTLTNVAGPIQWFDDSSGNSNRKPFSRTLTNGTPGILDHEDAHTVTAALSGWLFEKTVADLTSGINPATTAAPGDKLRYTLRFRTTTQALSNFRIFDELDALNARPDFAPGTLTLVTPPAGADISATSSTGGSKGTGVIDIRNLSLPANGEAVIQFDITLKPAIANGTVVTNQATLVAN